MLDPHYLCAAVTAFTPDGRIDLPANQALWDRIIDAGLDGIVVCGSSGEFSAMPEAMRREVAEEAAAHVGDRARLVVGTGAGSAEETTALSQHALETGADAVMVVTPYYVRLGRDALLAHYEAVAEEVDGPIYLYNYPALTGNDLDADLVLELAARYDSIIGIKDTVADMGHTRAIIDAVTPLRPDFEVWSGLDDNLAHNVLAGGAGCIGAIGNVDPDLVAAWLDALRDGDVEGIVAGQRAHDAAVRLYDVTPFIGTAVKEAAALRGLPVGRTCRASLAPLTPDQQGQVRQVLADLDRLTYRR